MADVVDGAGDDVGNGGVVGTTVVWWEQRGATLSYDPGIPAREMTAEQFVADTIEVTRYLIDRFDQPKIYLMGHSWGSDIGFYTFEESAHSPMFEEPARTATIQLDDVLNGTNSLADTP